MNPFLTYNVPLTDKPVGWFFTSKIFEKHLSKSDILSHRPASLLKMSIFHKRFSNALPVKTNYLVSS